MHLSTQYSLMYYAQLPGIARMFANEMTLASAWIHFLAVDLFAARYHLMFLIHNCACFHHFFTFLSFILGKSVILIFIVSV